MRVFRAASHSSRETTLGAFIRGTSWMMSLADGRTAWAALDTELAPRRTMDGGADGFPSPRDAAAGRRGRVRARGARGDRAGAGGCLGGGASHAERPPSRRRQAPQLHVDLQGGRADRSAGGRGPRPLVVEL